MLIWLVVFTGPFLIEKNAYYNARAKYAEKTDNYFEAEQYIRKAIQIHPEGYSYYETLGRVLFGLGDFAGALDTFSFLLDEDERLTPYYRYYYRLWQARALLESGRLREAREIIDILIKSGGGDFDEELRELLHVIDLGLDEE